MNCLHCDTWQNMVMRCDFRKSVIDLCALFVILISRISPSRRVIWNDVRRLAAFKWADVQCAPNGGIRNRQDLTDCFAKRSDCRDTQRRIATCVSSSTESINSKLSRARSLGDKFSFATCRFEYQSNIVLLRNQLQLMRTAKTSTFFIGVEHK